MARPRTHNYCDRELLHKELVLYKQTGHCSNELVKMFYDIIKGYSYTFKIKDKASYDDRSQLAIEHLIRYSHNYNPDKGTSFSYVTQIIKNAFRAYYNTDKKHYDRFGIYIDDLYSL